MLSLLQCENVFCSAFQGWYIVTYALGIYHLNLFIAFLSPKVDPSLLEEGKLTKCHWAGAFVFDIFCVSFAAASKSLTCFHLQMTAHPFLPSRMKSSALSSGGCLNSNSGRRWLML